MRVTMGVVEMNTEVRGNTIQAEFQPVLAKIRAELDEHLLSINENTDEVNQNFAYLEVMNHKIDFLAQRLDKMAMLLQDTPVADEKTYTLSRLTTKEKTVFSALYKLLTGGKDATYQAMSKELAMPQSLVSAYITNLMEKGVPIIKKRVGKHIELSLERGFQEEQAKKNIVGVNTLLTHWL